MKKTLAIFFTVISVSLGFCLNVDYGASIDSYVGSNIADDVLGFGFEKVSLYSSFQFTDTFSIAVDGFYKFTYNTETEPDDPHTFDLSTLVATMPIGQAYMMLGRNSFQDLSGDILSHTLDGLSMSIPLGAVTIIGNAGYSGLVNSGEVSLFTTGDDGDYIKRVIEGIDLVTQMESMSIWASVYSLQDIENIDNNISLYGGGGVSGSVGSALYYSLRGNYEYGYFPYLDSIRAFFSMAWSCKST